jgi:hypothetical protein
MQDENDNKTLPLLDSACKLAFCNFIGQKTFEGDNGWSYEVWRTAWNMALLSAIRTFETDDDESFYGEEVADTIRRYVQEQ